MRRRSAMRGSWSCGAKTRCSRVWRRSSARWCKGRTSRSATTGLMTTRSTATCRCCRILRCARSSQQKRRWLQRQISNSWRRIRSSRPSKANKTTRVSALAGVTPSSTRLKVALSTSPTLMKMVRLQERALPTRIPMTVFTLKASKRRAEASDPPRSPPCT